MVYSFKNSKLSQKRLQQCLHVLSNFITIQIIIMCPYFVVVCIILRKEERNDRIPHQNKFYGLFQGSVVLRLSVLMYYGHFWHKHNITEFLRMALWVRAWRVPLSNEIRNQANILTILKDKLFTNPGSTYMWKEPFLFGEYTNYYSRDCIFVNQYKRNIGKKRKNIYFLVHSPLTFF